MTDLPHDLLTQAAAELKRGSKATAESLIKQALHNDPHNADAWFLASFLTQVPEERRAVLEQAVKYNPTHEVARQALIRTTAADTSFSDLNAPSWMPDLTDLLPNPRAATQLPAPTAAPTWEATAIRILIGLLIIIAGLIFVVVILSP
ncbi:MAG: hypothetical protein KF716_05395 [Anaerolineae bacterium]|nr:hypothetical protein [Anaerolineae bacterium]